MAGTCTVVRKLQLSYRFGLCGWAAVGHADTVKAKKIPASSGVDSQLEERNCYSSGVRGRRLCGTEDMGKT